MSNHTTLVPEEAPAIASNTDPAPSRVLVIVPAFNEEERLSSVLHAIRQQKPGIDILVVDDGSTDETSAMALSEGASVARHPFNLGAGAACQTGYKFALERGYDFVVQLDADGQHDPESLDAVLGPVREGRTDLAVGSRFLWEGGYQPPLERRVGIWMFARIASLITGHRITDPTSGYRAMNRKTLRFCALDSFPHDFPDADLLITLHQAGLEVQEFPVLMHARQSGKSQHRGLRPLYYLFKMSLSIFLALLRERSRLSS